MPPRSGSSRSARRGDGPTLTVVRWQQIPVQVNARHGEETVKASLPPRFQQAVDRAAMGAGAAGSDAYVSHWARDQRPCSTDLSAEVAAEVAALDAALSTRELEHLVRAAREARRTPEETP